MAKAIFSGSESYFLSDAHHFEKTNNYIQNFTKHLGAEPGIRGHVLDIGCGAATPPFLVPVIQQCAQLDGVDPDPAVMQNPHLKQRWNSPLEKADVPSAAYDLAFAYYVAEHIADPRGFFTHVRRLLKPGGVFWAVTPHKRHLFPKLARWAELAGFKGMMHRRDPHVNSYSSYYRMNSRKQVLKHIAGLGFREASFYYYPAGWAQYFPRGTGWVAGAYDRMFGYRSPSHMMIIQYRLQVED